MSKRYTSQEMRETAKSIEANLVMSQLSELDDMMYKAQAMLRQAADDLEREKKYEYALVTNGVMYNNHYCDFRSATLTRGFGEQIVRRSVGEWDEVKT